MHNSKLTRCLKSLAKEEMRLFGLFVQSPFYNTNQKLTRFFQYLRPHHPGFSSPKLAKEKAWAHLFPGEAYDDNRMRQCQFLLTQLLEEFLAVSELKAEPQTRDTLLLKSLGRRKLYAYFSRKGRSGIKKMESLALKDAASHQRLQDWYEQIHFHPDTSKFGEGTQGLGACIHHLDQYFLLKKLEYGCEAASRKVMLNEEYSDAWLEDILQGFMEGRIKTDHFLVSLYKDLIQLQRQEKNHTLFVKIKSQFLEKTDLLSAQERIKIYQYLSNYAARLVNTGDRLYYKELFDLTKMALEYEIIVEKDRITDATFTNTVVMGSVLHEFAWVEKFMEQYQPLLDRRYYDSAMRLSLAYWNYHQKKYAEVLTQLQEIDFLPTYGFRVKSLRMRTLFELYQKEDSYGDSLSLEIQSFEQFIRREKKVTLYRKESYLHLISYLKKLVKLKYDPNLSLAKVESLKKEVEEKQPLFNKQWLLEKIAVYLKT